jgi:hypothetical protein
MVRLCAAFVLCVSFCLVGIASGAAAGQTARCRQTLIHDWYQDGSIQGAYRLSCYREALAGVPAGDPIYSTLRTDLTSALSSGIDRAAQKGVSAGPQTILPAPETRVATDAAARPQSSRRLLTLAAMALLLVLLVAWCIARWRSSASGR